MVHRSIGKRRAFPAIIPGTAVAAAGTHNGVTIEKPAKSARTLAFLLLLGTNAGVTVLTVKPQGRVGSGAWEVVKDQDGNDLQFEATDTVGGTAKILRGTLPIDRLPYDDYRLAVTTVTGATANVSAVAELADYFDSDDMNVKDHFFWDVTPYDETAPAATVNG